MPKSYQDIRLYNPTGEHRVVYLHENQNVYITLNADYGTLNLHSAFMDIELDSYNNAQRVFKIMAKDCIEILSKFKQRLHVGEVVLYSHNSPVPLIIELIYCRDTVKSELAIINPQGYIVRIKPNSQFSVNLFYSEHSRNAIWDYTVVYNSNGIMYDFINARYETDYVALNMQIRDRDWDDLPNNCYAGKLLFHAKDRDSDEIVDVGKSVEIILALNKKRSFGLQNSKKDSTPSFRKVEFYPLTGSLSDGCFELVYDSEVNKHEIVDDYD